MKAELNKVKNRVSVIFSELWEQLDQSRLDHSSNTYRIHAMRLKLIVELKGRNSNF